MEKEIAAIAATGVKVIVSGGKIGDLCLHYLNKYNIMGVRLNSKFDLRRLCKAINATALPRLVGVKKYIWLFIDLKPLFFTDGTICRRTRLC